MANVNFRETDLWRDAIALLTETYRLTADWEDDRKAFADDLRSTVRTIVRNVPGAFKKGGITGNMHLRMTQGNFADAEATCESVVALGLVKAGELDAILERLKPVEEQFRELLKASKEHARELFNKRTSLFDRDSFLDDDDDF